jgi:hypothetical protein
VSSSWTSDDEEPHDDDRDDGPDGGHDDGHDEPDDDGHDVDALNATAEAVVDELADTRRRLAEVPAEGVVANHAMGLFELGAIHLSSGPSHLPEAALAIDAMGALVEGLAGRLGENEGVLRDALQQIRLAFVQVKATASA